MPGPVPHPGFQKQPFTRNVGLFWGGAGAAFPAPSRGPGAPGPELKIYIFKSFQKPATIRKPAHFLCFLEILKNFDQPGIDRIGLGTPFLGLGGRFWAPGSGFGGGWGPPNTIKHNYFIQCPKGGYDLFVSLGLNPSQSVSFYLGALLNRLDLLSF